MYTFENIMEDLVDVTDKYIDSYIYSLNNVYPKQKRHHNYDYSVVENILDENTHNHFVEHVDSNLIKQTIKHPQVYNQYRLYAIKPRLKMLLEQYKQQHPKFEFNAVHSIDRLNGDYVLYMPAIPDILYFDNQAVTKNQALINRFVFNGGIEDVIEKSSLADFIKFANQQTIE